MKRAPIIVGHRGDPARFPDNSLAGFLSAAEVADMAELDARRSADGVAVLSHDPTVGGVTLVEHDATALTDVEIGDGHRLLRLTDLLDRIGDFPLNIEIKNDPADPDYDPTHEFAISVAELARPIDLITCFDWPTVESIRAAHPRVRTGLLVDARQDLDDAIAEARAGGHEAVAAHWTLLATDPAETLAGANDLDILAWTVNDPTVAAILAGAGIAGLITDDPVAIRSVVQEQT